MSNETYRIVGETGLEYHRARRAISETLAEAQLLGVTNTHRLAEAIMARLSHLDPPMLIVSMEDVGGEPGLAPR